MENKKDKSLIPPGYYCYTYKPDSEQPKDLWYPTKINLCPYYSHKEINGINIPWCEYLNLGGTVGDTTAQENQYEKLLEHYKTMENLDKELPLFLLFDQCKECGENMGGNYE